jgi:spermidine synthase
VGIGSALTGEALAALAALTLPTAVMGAAFSHLCLRAQAAGWRLGSAVAVNTLGAAIAPPLIGVVLLPALGAKWVIVGIALGYLALLPALKRRGVQAWLPAALALGLAGLGTELRFIDVEPGGRVLSHRDGAMAAVSVVEDADSVAHLRINNREQEGSSASGLADARLAYLPLLLHPAPRRALFLGLGTGVTAAAAAEDADLSVDVVELLPEVIAAAADFPRGADSPQPAHPLRILAGDARRFVRAAGPRYDLVVADLFHPARSGSGALYTIEHFEAVRERLAPGGLFCQWLALHQMDLATLRSIVAAFIRAYPGAVAVLASNSLATPVIGLIAHPDRQRFDAAAVRQRLAAPQGAARRAELGFSDEFAVLGSLVAGPAALARFAAGAPANTDDRPLVAHRAPLATYAPEAAPAQRLIDLLAGFQTDTESLATPPPTLSDDAVLVWRQRLAAYRAARQRFIEIGVGVRPDADPARMLAQVEQPLLGVLRQSADFRPALDPLLAMAVAVAATEPLHARRLLGDLIALRPDRTDLTQALRRLP